MENYLLNVVMGTSGIWSYLVIFAVLVVCGLGVPLPEDISLVLGGFLVHLQKAHLIPMIATGYLGIICGDLIIFLLGRRFGGRTSTLSGGLLGRLFTPAKRARVESLFEAHGEKIVLAARFLPGVRAVTYFTAGSVGMRIGKFAFYDSVAALGSAPLFVFLGFHFGAELESLMGQIRRGQTKALIGVGVVVAGFALFSWYRSRRAARIAATALPTHGGLANPRPKTPAEG